MVQFIGITLVAALAAELERLERLRGIAFAHAFLARRRAWL